ncbi:FkbM family methyltransferase [Pseudoxanthomonas sp. UTMC 1351]|uniref:FkbM family methyltransferase n=1 Tax=Pseudoxanthomonas sp. UTMC 1351 TaxID=2695853 RepID=UPI0034CE1A2B
MSTTFVSYAQNFEDVLLWRALKHVESGFYIDIGANSPVIDSVSLAFYEKGWRGVNVEPSLPFINELREQRPHDINLHAALSGTAGLLKFYDIPETGLSTLLEDVALQHAQSGFQVREDWISVVTLDDVLDDLPQADVHWMKIDVEGAEKQVLEGWKSSSIRPWVVMLEGVEPNSHADSYADWEPFLLQKGYRFVHFDGLNRYYVSERQLHLADAFKVGPNVFDMFCLSGTATSTFTSLLSFQLRERADQLSAAEEQARSLIEEQGKLSGAIAEAEERVKTLSEKGARLGSEKIALQETIQHNQVRYEQEKGALQMRLIEVLSGYRELTQERDAAKESFRQQSHQLSVAVAEADVLRSGKSGLLEELRGASKRLEEKDAALRSAEARALELLNSSSWKVTAPLRLLTELMRGSRKGMSLYLGETLRNLAEVPGVRGLARRLIPENGRLRRALTARILPIASTTTAPPSLQGTENVPGSERVRLVGRMTDRVRQESVWTESQE